MKRELQGVDNMVSWQRKGAGRGWRDRVEDSVCDSENLFNSGMQGDQQAGGAITQSWHVCQRTGSGNAL